MEGQANLIQAATPDGPLVMMVSDKVAAGSVTPGAQVLDSGADAVGETVLQ